MESRAKTYDLWHRALGGAFRGALGGAIGGLAAGYMVGIHHFWLALFGGFWALAGASVQSVARAIYASTWSTMFGALFGMAAGGFLGHQVGGLMTLQDPDAIQPGNVMEIAGPTLQGGAFDVAQWRGKYVLVDFWATWCPPCVGEIPHIKRVYDRYHDQGFEVVGVSLDRSRERLQSFVATNQLPWPEIFYDDPALRAGAHPLAIKYNIDSIPRSFLLDREGRVIATELRESRLDSLVAHVLGKHDAEPYLDQAASIDSGVSVIPVGLLLGALVGCLMGSVLGACADAFFRHRRNPVV